MTAGRGAPTPRHLTASMRVVASHAHQRHVTVATARAEVLKAAQRHREGGWEEADRLVARLEKACSCSIDELVMAAEGWPS